MGTRLRTQPLTSLVLLLVLGACSSNGSEPLETGTSSVSESLSISPSASPTEEPPDLTSLRFETPSGNIHCESAAVSLTCVIGSDLNPEPSHDFCPVDWIGLVIRTGQYAGPVCSGDPGISREPAPVLEYGQTWVVADVTCLSESSGLTCTDESGNGFTLAQAGWSLLGKAAAARAALQKLRSLVRKRAQSDLPDQIAAVSRPVLGGGAECGELQPAFVETELTSGGNAVYEACYVTGSWVITAGPLYPD
ncbi:MAG TPA: DUF6636 domain-containing protein [Actinomycetota bacterium]|jgi:hypothetical protein